MKINPELFVIPDEENFGDPFFNKDFHRRVYIWGIFITIIEILIIFVVYFYFGESSFIFLFS